LDLQQSYQGLHRRYSKDRKLNLKAGLKMRWEIAGSDDLGPLIALFAENHAPQIGRIGAGAYQTLEKLCRKCIQTGCGSLTYARSASHVRAGMMLTCYGGQTIYLFNAAEQVGRKGNARVVMLDAYFRENVGCRPYLILKARQRPPSQLIMLGLARWLYLFIVSKGMHCRFRFGKSNICVNGCWSEPGDIFFQARI
jgi:hypothetical protein